MKRLLALLSFCLLVGCGYPKHLDPPLYTFETQMLTALSANAHAKSIGGVCYRLANTHSMEPSLRGDDYVVIDTRVAFDAVKLGQIVNYLADWQPNGPTVVHRATVRDADGLLVEGDNVDGEHPENHWRVTAANYRGLVAAIYRTKP